jgi:hypothetical protein
VAPVSRIIAATASESEASTATAWKRFSPGPTLLDRRHRAPGALDVVVGDNEDVEEVPFHGDLGCGVTDAAGTDHEDRAWDSLPSGCHRGYRFALEVRESALAPAGRIPSPHLGLRALPMT